MKIIIKIEIKKYPNSKYPKKKFQVSRIQKA